MNANANQSKKKDDGVLSHNIAVAPNFSYPPKDFYERVERELADMKIPGIAISRIEYAEGGLLSNARTYLRVIRERFAFDTCAAPFGTQFFFSYRSIYTPAEVKLWHILAVLFVLNLTYGLLVRPLGLEFAALAVLSLVIATIQVFKNAVASQLSDLDTLLLKIPALGPIYETWFRKDTFFRQDTRLVYLEVFPRVVQGIINDITAEKGVKLLNQYERAPILGDLYKPKPKAG